MNLTIQSLHFTSKEKLNEFITNKINKLARLSDKIDRVNVCLKLDESATNENKVCEIKLSLPGHELFAKKQSDSFEAATTEAVKALEHQVKKHIGA